MNVYRDGEKEKEEIDILRASATSSTGVENQSVGGEGDGTAFFLRPFFFFTQHSNPNAADQRGLEFRPAHRS